MDLQQLFPERPANRSTAGAISARFSTSVLGRGVTLEPILRNDKPLMWYRTQQSLEAEGQYFVMHRPSPEDENTIIQRVVRRCVEYLAVEGVGIMVEGGKEPTSSWAVVHEAYVRKDGSLFWFPMMGSAKDQVVNRRVHLGGDEFGDLYKRKGMNFATVKDLFAALDAAEAHWKAQRDRILSMDPNEYKKSVIADMADVLKPLLESNVDLAKEFREYLKAGGKKGQANG